MTLLEEKRSELANLASEPVTWEDTLDGLGLEDFPERDYFLEAGRLLREACSHLREAHSMIPTTRWRQCADHIDKLLAGEGLL
jgi:hypothetical protein